MKREVKRSTSGLRFCTTLSIAVTSHLAAGCAFFDLCSERDDCESTSGTGGVEQGTAEESAGGDGSGGDGSGGDGSGGDGSGGNGSGAAAGSGGTEPGAGGVPSTDGGGGGGAALEADAARINEMRAHGFRYVELYNTGDRAIPEGRVVVSDGLTSCTNEEPIPASGLYLFATSDCPDFTTAPCSVCNLTISSEPPTTVELTNGQDVIHAVTYPSAGSPGRPTIFESWGALVEGGDTFKAHLPSPGECNAGGTPPCP